MANNKTMLVVDDLKVNRSLLCAYFAQDYIVVQAKNGIGSFGAAADRYYRY